MTHWFLLLLAIALEICGTVCIKLSHGFTRIVPSVLMFVFYGFCFVALTYAMKKIDLSVAYAIWSGLGIVVITGIGYFYFEESIGALRLAFIVLILFGVVGLKLTSR